MFKPKNAGSKRIGNFLYDNKKLRPKCFVARNYNNNNNLVDFLLRGEFFQSGNDRGRWCTQYALVQSIKLAGT